MTVERAAELVAKLRGHDAYHLFDHFVDFFNFDENQIESFARLCGFVVAVLR